MALQATPLLFIAAVVSFACTALSQPYPNCPLTGLAPAPPSIPPSRCLLSSSYSCCGDCGDLTPMLGWVSLNVSQITKIIAPEKPKILNGFDDNVCTWLQPYTSCETDIEFLLCGITCDPGAGNYIQKNGSTLQITLCQAFALDLYQQCNTIALPGGQYLLGQVIFGLPDLLTRLTGALTQLLGYGNFTIITANPDDVGPGNCFSGPNIIEFPDSAPVTTACCDPMPISKCCPADTGNFTHYPERKKDAGRQVDQAYCDVTLLPPPPPANAKCPAKPPPPLSPLPPSPLAPALTASPSPSPATGPGPIQSTPASPPPSSSPSAPSTAPPTSYPPPPKLSSKPFPFPALSIFLGALALLLVLV